ncbi:MAG: acyl carrier protein [Phycisphaerae bacterium]|jgi:acyl carrier protein|nr:acyl carrier protein [Phycisphaerae bacterium]
MKRTALVLLTLVLLLAGCDRRSAGDPYRQAVEMRVRKIVGEQFGLDPSMLKLTDRFREDFKSDELDTVELTMEFEDAFTLSIPDEVALKMNTIKDVVDYIERHRKSR